MKRKKLKYIIGLLVFILLSPWVMKIYSKKEIKRLNTTKNPYKIYVALGFHVSMRHSWRGDTNDEAGFGTDIRVVRKIIKILNKANKKGLDARGTWDFNIRWTIEEILKGYAPDILLDIKKRVELGYDEVVLGPYNNGLVAASTEEEFKESIKRAFTNERKSGLVDIFGKITPLIRPQEMMFTTGQIPLYKKLGVKYLSLYYSSIPFNSFSNFIPKLSIEERFNPLYLKTKLDGEKIILIPTYNPGDVLNHYSLKKWLIDLRRAQIKGKVKSDLIIYINLDADAESWTGIGLPSYLEWIPNSSGLKEYINVVNELNFVQFTSLEDYIKGHPPKGEIIIKQDLADGSFDGFSSWAEKFSNHKIWTDLEKSRWYSYQADYLLRNIYTKEEIKNTIWGKKNLSFVRRFETLSTTHFGMSSPIINEERLQKAKILAKSAKENAYQALRLCKELTVEKIHGGRITNPPRAGFSSDIIYAFEIFNFEKTPSKGFIKIPLILTGDLDEEKLILHNEKNKLIPFSLLDKIKTKEKYFANLTFVVKMRDYQRERFFLKMTNMKKTKDKEEKILNEVSNKNITLKVNKKSLIKSLLFNEVEYGGDNFIRPFLTYKISGKNKVFRLNRLKIEPLFNERWEDLKRIRLKGEVNIVDGEKKYPIHLEYIFTLFNDLPYLFVDVKVKYPYTPEKHILRTVAQRLGRKIDLNWVEVAPFQITPSFLGTKFNEMRVWKHNYLNITSSYELNFGDINWKNKEVDSFNNHITKGWVAVSNGRQGILIAQCAAENSVFAFVPMRLRGEGFLQRISLNPFGTYFGRQFDYSHLGGNGVGEELMTCIAPHLKSTAPSYNGKEEEFSLMIAPYIGDAPQREVQRDALGFFYPYGIIYMRSPFKEKVVCPEDIKKLWAEIMKEKVGDYKEKIVAISKTKGVFALSEVKNIPISLIFKILFIEIIAFFST